MILGSHSIGQINCFRSQHKVHHANISCLQADLRGKVDPEVDFFGERIFDQRMRDPEDFFGNMGIYFYFYFGDGVEFRIFEQQT